MEIKDDIDVFRAFVKAGILRLIGRVISVSLETVSIVKNLPDLLLAPGSPSASK